MQPVASVRTSSFLSVLAALVMCAGCTSSPSSSEDADVSDARDANVSDARDANVSDARDANETPR